MATIVKRGKSWMALVRMKKARACETFNTRKQAEDWARVKEAQLRLAKEPRGLGPDRTTLAVALLDYAHLYSATKKSIDREVMRINSYLAAAGLPVLKVRREADGCARLEDQSLSEQLAALPEAFAAHRTQRVAKRPRVADLRARLAITPVSKVTSHALREYCNAMLAEGLTGDTIRLELAILRNMFNMAATEWHWVTLTSPFIGFKLPKRNKSRDRRLSPNESERFFTALDECRNKFVKPFVLLAIETAMRRSEILLSSTWADVDLGARFIHLRDTKNGDARSVPLTQRALAILQALPRVESDDRVFQLSLNELKCAWSRLLARANIKDFRVHDLRHEAASRHAERLGGDIFKLRQITGHKTLKMLERYVHPGLDELFAKLDSTEPPPQEAPPEAAAPPTTLPPDLPSNVVPLRRRIITVAAPSDATANRRPA